MKKYQRAIALLAVGMALSLTACAPNQEEKTPDQKKTLAIPVYAVDPTIDQALVEKYKDRPDGANASAFYAERIIPRENSPLKDKTFYWLGSSVTYGSASNRETMADMLSVLTGCVSVKEAVSGTTLFTDDTELGKISYVTRLQNSEVLDRNQKIDAFICQISTNDARPEVENYGTITPADQTDRDSFDLSTSIGGVEYIISYVTETWHCPVYFYAGAKHNNQPYCDLYAELIDDVYQVAEKWNALDGYQVGIIDLFNDSAFNALVDEDMHDFLMQDGVHPKKAGYALWWTPYFEDFLLKNLT